MSSGPRSRFLLQISALTMFFFACLLLSGLVLTSGQSESNATLSDIKIWPCSGTTHENVSLYKSDIYTVVNSVSLCGDNWTPSTANGLVVHAYAEAVDGNNLTQSPVVFVARQREDGIVSWTIPLKPQGFSTLFYQVNRTVCPISPQQPGNLPLLYVDVFSSSPTPVNYSISIEAIGDFEIKVVTEEQDENSTFLVAGAAAPQIRYVRFPNDSDVLTVQAKANNSKCVFISIQNNTCPVNDLLRTAQSRGIFQTMSTSAFLTVRASEVQNREFLVIIITTTFSVCHSSDFAEETSLNNETDPFEQIIELQVKKLLPASHIIWAILLPLLIFSAVGMLGSIAPFCCLHIRWTPWSHCSRGKSTVQNNNIQSETEKIINTTVPSYQSTASGSEECKVQSVTRNDDEVLKNKKMLSDTCKVDYEKLKKQYSVYGWNTFTVGIFYALPAFQLVFSEQRLLNSSGNQDQCYYNFKCAYPVGVLSAFNNIWSNVGYVILGFFFLAVVFFRNRKYNKRRQEAANKVDTHGVPQYFGIYYAMGIALIIEGFMSSFYHICPTNANFQFDTAFMFIIGGIFLVKMFQNRHPDIHANSFLAFFSFAVLILFTLFGLYYDHQHPVEVRMLLFLVILGILLVFFVSFYHFHELKFIKETLRNLRENVKSFCTTAPQHKGHFFTLFSAFIINLVMVILMIALYKKLDIATCVVIFFLINLSFFLLLYIVKKLYYKEPMTILPLVLFVLIVFFWGFAFFFFFTHVSDWSLTPAESRELNRECALLGFYDFHDIWHFLSACAMFVTFLFMLVVDDGVADMKRDQLNVF
ncbi:SID1 transmembrane family member 1-like isoform X2 [Halichondria panicea]|uniref:SID1 transmembrane family member 1-like isoform X2 n=1 Tax=Halichondria panicea TaxID=6063 RepID=UPI00312B497D